MLRNLIFCIILHLCRKVASQAVDPPVMRVNNPGGSDDMSMKYSVSIRKYPQVIQPPVTASDAKTTSTKRDVNLIDGITTLSTYEQNLLEPEEDLSPKNCAFTFTLPNPVPRNQQVCVTEVGEMMMPSRDEYDDYDNAVELNEMREEVSNIQESVLDIRNQLEQQTPQADLEPIKNEVEQLQEESRNTNSRLSQLYIQFLSEIIRAKDDTIEFTQIENDVLNITVRYHELKDRHYDLVSNHEILKQKSNAQQEQINYLQQQMEDMTVKMNRVALQSEEAAAWCRQIAASYLANQAKEEIGLNAANASLPPAIQVDFRDCSEVQRAGFSSSGKYDLTIPDLDRKVKVWCDFDQDPGGWTVIQRRSVGRINFYRNMASYQRGFGSLESDFWLGLDNIHELTSQSDRNYKLHIDMEDWNGITTFVEYGSFKIGGEGDGYRLKIAHYSGTAGDSLTWHNNMKFSTKNVDNDPFRRNCAHHHKGGWWYRTCAHSNLNGIYYSSGLYTGALHSAQDGIFWSAWRRESYSLKRVEMKIMTTE